uniref:Cytochrome P450 n=1 Tax=Pristionchus pacificus TaxID=54126 RepID=A0A8R1UHU6_PRIPA
MIGVVLIAIAILTLIVNRILSERKFLKLRDELGLQGPPAEPFFGNFRYLYKIMNENGIGATPMIYPDLVQKFGNTFGLYIGPEFEIITTDPTIIKEVFISQFSNFIDRRRLNINMAYPMLDGLLQMHLMFHDQMDNLIDGEIASVWKGEFVPVGPTVGIFEAPIPVLVDRNTDYYSYARTFFANTHFGKSIIFELAIFIPMFRHLRQFTTFGRAEKIIIKKLSASIHEREKDRANGIIRKLPPDVIDLILAENEKRVENGKIPLHHDVIVSNAWALFIAGYETTSSALAYASYLLAKHPEAQATLHEEVLSTFGDVETIDYERVMKLPYMHAVFSETLRFYPPVTTLSGRTCIKETVIGGKIRVPVGVGVVTPVQAVMWSEENFDRPREFLDDKSASAWSATYLPFGIGPRNCVGARFAEMEFKTVLAAVIRRFAFELDPEHEELQTMTGNVLQTPKGNQLFVRLVERISASQGLVIQACLPVIYVFANISAAASIAVTVFEYRTILTYEFSTRWKALKLREELGLSGPPADLFLGSRRYYNKVVSEKGLERIPHIFGELEKEYGSTYGLYLGTYLEIMTTDPHIIKEVFISQFGSLAVSK